MKKQSKTNKDMKGLFEGYRKGKKQRRRESVWMVGKTLKAAISRRDGRWLEGEQVSEKRKKSEQEAALERRGGWEKEKKGGGGWL